MKVRAKFVCLSVEQYEHTTSVKMQAVYSDTGENKDFTDATPNGQLNISIDNNAPASGMFKPAKEYYLDFTEAEN